MSKAYLCAVCKTIHDENDSVRVEDSFVCYACIKLGSIYIKRRDGATKAFSDEQSQHQGITSSLQLVSRTNTIPSIKEMVAYLDKYIIGQDKAKASLSLSFYVHLVRHATKNFKLPSSNIILIGSTGSGKTYMVQKLCQFNDLLLSHSDVSRWTEGAYIGGKSVDCLIPVMQEKNDERAAKSVVFLDEIDKVVGDNKSPAQGEVLRIIEGSVITDSEIESAKKGHTSLRFARQSIDTSGILFIGAGAFSKIDDVLNARKKSGSSIGFGSVKLEEGEMEITQEDLVSFGLMPELLGRMHRIAKLNTLTKNDLIDIMIKSEDSVLAKYKEFFSVHHKSLVVDDDILEEIAERSLKLKTGARGLTGQLTAVLESKILELDYSNDKENGVVRISKSDLKEFKDVQ